MRPLRIRVEGFSAYREPVDVDFADVDFFSLTGPTGSGKSSLIDAMIFALFGRVPRLGGNAVAPAISAGADRARVRFDFSIGATTYTAARMAQRTATGGASVREARLEQGDVALAEGADDVTAAVEEILRLRFDDFTRTVVLPQGDFARFLTATKSERQGLLRSLLGLDVYPLVRELARTKAAVAGDRAEGAQRALEGLQLADSSTMEAATRRRDALELLATVVTDEEAKMSRLDREVEAARAGVERLVGWLNDLADIQPPAQLGELDTLTMEARSRMFDAEEAERLANQELAEAESSLSALPSAEQISSWRRDRTRLDDLEGRLERSSLEEAEASAAHAEIGLSAATSDLEAADRSLEDGRSRHAAHALASGLRVGEPCPVCRHPVSEMPEAGPSSLLEDLEDHRRVAQSRVEAARGAADAARETLARLEAARSELEGQAVDLEAALSDAPATAELETLAEKRAGLDEELRRRRERLSVRERETALARTALERLADASRRVSKLLTSAQLRVAALEPPVSESDDVVVQWKELLAWRDSVSERLGEELSSAKAGVEAAVAAAVAARHGLTEMLLAHDLVPEEPYSVMVAMAHQAARSEVESYQRAEEQAGRLRELAVSATEEAAVANALAGHLRADGFEQWMMAGALTELVSGANDLLGQLSAGGYSLASDDSGSFSIVDHRNADESRSVSTLSGGETFLVSLALALSLAETLSAKGGSGLDAIILDEGFGTLDDESLDTVASVLEELTGRGLMVGIITHVKELAARAPVRYEVRRDPAGAKVSLVS